MVLELEDTHAGDWNRFQLRNIGLAAQRRMAARYEGEVARFTVDAVRRLSHAPGMDEASSAPSAGSALKDFAIVISLVEDFSNWSDSEKRDLAKIIRAKASGDESRYLKLMQNHARLRTAMLKLGSESRGV